MCDTRSMADPLCAACGKSIPPDASKAIAQHAVYHPICWERATRGRL